MSRHGSLVVFATLLLLARPARAAGIVIGWRAPAGCGTQADFEAGVSRIVGKPIAELESAWASADVQIEPSSEAFRLRVRVVSRAGSPRERDLSTATCREGLQAAELIVATNLSQPEPLPEPTEAPAPAQPVAKAHLNRDAPPRPLRPSSPLTVALDARVGVAPRLLPSLAALGWLALGLESKRFKLEASGGASSHATQAVSGGGALVASWLAAALVGCFRAPQGALRLWLCAGGEAGRYRAAGQAGTNLLNARTSDRFWSAALLQGELLLDVTRGASLGLGFQGVAALRSIHVSQTNSQNGESNRLYSTPWLDVRPFVGIEGRF